MIRDRLGDILINVYWIVPLGRRARSGEAEGDQAGAGGAHDEEQEPGGAQAAAEEARGRVAVKGRPRWTISAENFQWVLL